MVNVVTDLVSEFDATLPQAARDLITRVRAFAREHVAPYARDWEYRRELPRQTLTLASQAGLAGVEVPREAGGWGLGYTARLRMVEELARHDLGFAFSLVNHHNVIARLATPSIVDPGSALASWVAPMMAGQLIGCTAMTEPSAGSDFSAIGMTASRVPGGWVLNGEKAWITNAAVADVFMVYAQTEPGSGAKGIACFMLRADLVGSADRGEGPAFERMAPFALHGGHSIGAGGFRLRNCFIAQNQMIYPAGSGFKAAMAGVNGARTYVAAMCAGMLDESLRLAIAYGEQRQAFGRSLLDNQGLRWSLVDAATDLEAMRLLTYRAARQIEAGVDAQRAAAIAKKFANEHTLPAIAACMQAMGANGLRSDYPLARHLAAAKLLCYTDGSVEMMNDRIGQLLRNEHH